MFLRGAAVVMLVGFLGGCSGGSAKLGGTLAKQQYLSAIEAVPAPMRTGATGAPMVGLVISGTITNDGASPLHCSPAEFVLVQNGGDGVAPSSEFCTLPSVAPRQSTYFTASFPQAPRDDLQLRFEHGDGSYEIHDLAVPPG
jgi:hypothetical protein